jgi:hypothetical protein
MKPKILISREKTHLEHSVPFANNRYMPHQIPLTAREIYLKLGKNHADWNDKNLCHYLTECRKYGISLTEIGITIERSATWVNTKCAELNVPKPLRIKKPTPIPRRVKPSKPRTI